MSPAGKQIIYDPHTGRFVQEDPIRQASGDDNLQRYVGNNPLVNVDPNGRASAADAEAALGAAEQQFAKVRAALQNSHQVNAALQAEYIKYLDLSRKAGQVVNEYEEGQGYVRSYWNSDYNYQLSSRVNAFGTLPIPTSRAELAASLDAAKKFSEGQGRRAEQIAAWDDDTEFARGVAKGVGTTLAVGVIIIATAGAATPFIAPVYVYLTAGGVITYQLGKAVVLRAQAHQTFSQVTTGSVSDIFGWTDIYAGLYNRDYARQNYLGLTPGERGESLGRGGATAFLWAAGPRIFKEGQAAGQYKLYGGMLPPLGGSFAPPRVAPRDPISVPIAGDNPLVSLGGEHVSVQIKSGPAPGGIPANVPTIPEESPFQNVIREDYTRPSGERHSSPSGPRTVNLRNAPPEMKRGIEVENESADTLARKGYKVEQNPTVTGEKIS